MSTAGVVQISGQLCRALDRPVRRSDTTTGRDALSRVIPQPALLRHLHRRSLSALSLRRSGDHSNLYEHQTRSSNQVGSTSYIIRAAFQLTKPFGLGYVDCICCWLNCV